MPSGEMLVNDGLLSLALSSRGGEGTGTAACRHRSPCKVQGAGPPASEDTRQASHSKYHLRFFGESDFTGLGLSSRSDIEAGAISRTRAAATACSSPLASLK